MSKKNIAIIGNGVYGVALAYLLGKKHDVTVFGREIKAPNEHTIGEYTELGGGFDYLIISITTKGLSELMPKLNEGISKNTHVILAMKGLTSNGLLPIDECRKLLRGHRISVLSGPGFAEEIMSQVPVHLVLAGQHFTEEEEGDFLVDNLTLDFSHDVYGVSWCGVLKNIYAIGAGMSSKDEGFERSDYTRDAVHEMSLILEFLGCEKDTAHGPAGRGDVWVCTTPHSRNFRFGAGDESLREQAEGYNAYLKIAKILDPKKYPLMNLISRRIHDECSSF